MPDELHLVGYADDVTALVAAGRSSPVHAWNAAAASKQMDG